MRISEHEAAKAKELAEQTARIEAAAKLKTEKEAAAKLEREAQAIRNEERKKVETEQAKKYQEDMAKAQAETNKAVAPLAEKPVEQRLAERFADTESTEQVPETKIIPEGGRTHSCTEVTRMTPHQAMIKDVNFWAGEYGVINSEYSDLMNILNKYK